MPKYETFPVRAKKMSEEERLQDNIKRLEHETNPTMDYRIDHAAENGTACRWCVIWVRKFTENLPDPLFEPDTNGYMPNQPRQ